jgi:hypothetical protein
MLKGVRLRKFAGAGAGDIRDLTFRWAWNLCDVLAAIGVGFPILRPRFS